MNKGILKNRFFSKRLKIKQNTKKNKTEWFLDGVSYFQSEKSSDQVSAVPKLVVSL